MANGLGVLLIVVGLVLLVGAVDLPGEVRDVASPKTLGWTLLIVGVLVRVWGLARDARRRRAADPHERRGM